MINDPLVKIENMIAMSKHIGKDVAKTNGISLSEMKNYIKPKEIKAIIQQYCVKQKDDYLLNTLILQQIYKEVTNWVIGIQLCSMAAQGHLESHWDSEQNCIIFEPNKETLNNG